MAEIITKRDKLLQKLESKNIDDMKANKIKEVKQQAYKLLSETDWYITRKAETGESIPQEILDKRENIRSQSENIEQEINNITSKEELYNYTISFED